MIINQRAVIRAAGWRLSQSPRPRSKKEASLIREIVRTR